MIIIFCLLAGMIILTFFLANRYLNNKIYIISLFLIAFGVRIGWVIAVDTPVISDFYLMYNSALAAAKGDFSFSDTPYFQSWVYQLGYTMYQALIIKLFGEGTFYIKLINVLYSVGTTILVYKIAARIFHETAGRIAGLIYGLFIPSIVMTSVLTNQHLATFLFYLAFYLLITYYSRRFIWVFVGVLLSLGDIIRPLGSLILLAVAIYLFITEVLGENRKAAINAGKKFIGIIVVYFLIHSAVSQLFIAADVTKFPLSNRDPQWKFVLGFNHETMGRYSDSDAAYVGQFPIGNERKKAEMKLINERMADKQQLLVLFREKLKIMWGHNDDSITWGAGHFQDLTSLSRLYKFERLMYASIIIYLIVSLFYMLKDKSIGKQNLLFVLLILGYAAVHLLIEVQTRYRYFILPSFVIIQSYGVYSIYMIFNKLLRREKLNNG